MATHTDKETTVKFRTETRIRRVEKVVDGKVHEVDQKYKVEVPVPPRDLDATVLRAVTVGTCLVVAGAVAWSTVSIGDLLSQAAPTWVSYLVAAVFDLAWIGCLAVEWLARFDQRRARLPKVAGWVALAVSMAAIFTHGALAGSMWVGVFGALVSAIAKGMWFVVMRHQTCELDDETRQWVEAERSEVNGQRALAAITRQLNRTRAATADELAALDSGRMLVSARTDSVRTPDGRRTDTPDTVSGQPDTRIPAPALTGPDARTDTPDALSALAKEASGPADLVRTLSGHGVRLDEVATVAARLRPDMNADSIRRTAKRMQEKQGQPMQGGYA